MSIWDDFHARHGRRNFTPAYNLYLESQINKQGLEIAVRVQAWLLRRSWGNHSDVCVSPEGAVQTQSDCARDLGVDRREVNPVFLSLAKRNYVRFDGREISLVDNPDKVFAETSPNVGPFPTNSEDEANGFSYFLQSVWGANHPDELRELQEVEKKHKEIRTRILAEWKAYKQMSERVRQDEPGERPKGSDNASERVRQAVGEGATKAVPLLISENVKQEKLASRADAGPETLIETAVAASGLADLSGNQARAIRNAAAKLSTTPPNQRQAIVAQFERDCGQLAERRRNRPKNWGIVVSAMDDAIAEVRRNPQPLSAGAVVLPSEPAADHEPFDEEEFRRQLLQPPSAKRKGASS